MGEGSVAQSRLLGEPPGPPDPPRPPSPGPDPPRLHPQPFLGRFWPGEPLGRFPEVCSFIFSFSPGYFTGKRWVRSRDGPPLPVGAGMWFRCRLLWAGRCDPGFVGINRDINPGRESPGGPRLPSDPGCAHGVRGQGGALFHSLTDHSPSLSFAFYGKGLPGLSCPRFPCAAAEPRGQGPGSWIRPVGNRSTGIYCKTSRRPFPEATKSENVT